MNLSPWEMDAKKALQYLFQNKYLVLHIGEMKFKWVSQGCVKQKLILVWEQKAFDS